MRCTLLLVLTLVAKPGPAAAQAASPDSQIAQPMLTEIRELRQDLRNIAATIQRVQIVMYRLQAQAALVEKAAQRLEQARGECKLAHSQQKIWETQIEQTEARRRNSQNASDEKNAELRIRELQSSLETMAGEAQHCQVEQVDAETQYQGEQAKMNELQSQLDQLDQVLAGHGRK